MKRIETIQSSKLAVSSGPFSTGVKANGFLFLSGQVGIYQDGKLATDFDLEVKQIFKNIEAVLSEQKLTFNNIVSVTVYLKDMILIKLTLTAIIRQGLVSQFWNCR